MTPIFVFGSNLAGIHGAGAALEAHRNWGAQWGTGHGFSGNSYAIPTKDHEIQTLPLKVVAAFVDQFIEDAQLFTNCFFFVTPIGCGLAGYTHEDIAPLFKRAAYLSNVGLCNTWLDILNTRR